MFELEAAGWRPLDALWFGGAMKKLGVQKGGLIECMEWN